MIRRTKYNFIKTKFYQYDESLKSRLLTRVKLCFNFFTDLFFRRNTTPIQFTLLVRSDIFLCYAADLNIEKKLC